MKRMTMYLSVDTCRHNSKRVFPTLVDVVNGVRVAASTIVSAILVVHERSKRRFAIVDTRRRNRTALSAQNTAFRDLLSSAHFYRATGFFTLSAESHTRFRK